ncbi:hypothetical protein IAR50_003964 [Cryptococcus sp. DSM 104548]
MATLGPRNKKITRKQLAAVDLAKTCELIAEPPEPMALRLSGALLVGVARVYNQSFDLFYSDVTTFHANLRRSIATDFNKTTGAITAGGPLELPNDGQIRSDLITIGGLDFDWDMSSWDAEFAHVDWNDPLAPDRKRRASSVLSSAQEIPSSRRIRDDRVEDEYDLDLDEEEGYESEVGRTAKRKKFSASPAYSALYRTPLHQHRPSNPLFSRNNLEFQQEVDLGLNLDLDFDGPAGADDSFSGPSGDRGFEIPMAPMDDYDIGPDMPALMDDVEGPVIFYDVNGEPLAAEQQVNIPSRQPSFNANDNVLENAHLETANRKKRKVKQPKKVVFDSSLEINEEEDRQARASYRERMEKDRKEALIKEMERRLELEAISMVEGAGGFEFFDADMDNWFSSLTRIAEFKWEADVARSKNRKKGLVGPERVTDNDGPNERDAAELPQDFEMSMAPMDDYDVQGYMQDARRLPGGEIDFGQNDAYVPPICDDYEVSVRDREGSMARGSDVEYGRRDSVRSGGNLPWEMMAAGSTPGGAYPDFADTSFSPGSLRFSNMTPQEVRIRQNSRSGKDTGSQLARRNRVRSSSLMSDRPDDDPLMLARARSAELDLPSHMDLDDILPSETQEARLADLPDAFRPEMLATLEQQCRDFLTYVEKRMIGLGKEQVVFDELVSRTSKKHIAAVAFYDCLTLATKKIVSVDQPEPWQDINIRFASKPFIV